MGRKNKGNGDIFSVLIKLMALAGILLSLSQLFPAYYNRWKSEQAYQGIDDAEVLVQKAIAKLVDGKTVIMIAHRLRTEMDADQILVLDNGKLIEQGAI